MTTEALRAHLVEAAARGVAPRLDAAIWIEGELHAFGSEGATPAPFDLASLTKPLATGLVTLSLAADGKLGLDDSAGHGASVRQLLDHSAGYRAWSPFFADCFSDATARGIFQGERSPSAFARSKAIVATGVASALPTERPGTRTIYSDVGFLKLQQHLESVAREPFGSLFAKRVAGPLGLDLTFIELTGSHGSAPNVAPTGTLRPRPPAPGQEEALASLPRTEVGLQPGEVDDDNAFALGGIAGHAGLFGTARSVALAGGRVLEDLAGGARLGPAELVRTFCGPSGPGGRGLGWDRPSGQSSLGELLGKGRLGAIGHLGFTGCSLWLDLDRRIAIALCTNRVLLGRGNQQIRDFRRSFHDAVARSFGLA